jgi:hypothetical protein
MVLLAALLGVIAEQYRTESADDPRDRLGYATVAARSGDHARALSFAASAAAAGDREVCLQALSLSAAVARKRGDAGFAVESLRRALGIAGRATSAAIHLELAKLYEHRMRDPQRALHHARQVSAAESMPAEQRRLDRLERKLLRLGNHPSLDAYRG